MVITTSPSRAVSRMAAGIAAMSSTNTGSTLPATRMARARVTRWPDEMAAWLASPDVAPPGGESLHQVSARVGAALQGVLDRYAGRRILIVAHVGTIRALTARALDTPASSMNRMELAPASITTLTWYADGNASMRSFAESAHVDGLGTTWIP